MQTLSTQQAAPLGPPVSCQGGNTVPPAPPRPRPSGAPVIVVDPTKLGWVELELVNARGEQVPGAAFELTDSEGGTVRDRLGDAGRIRVEGLPPGTCTVRFPDHDAKPA